MSDNLIVPPTTDATSDDADLAYENGLAVAREEFALAWLRRWTAAGGSVILGQDEKFWFGRPTFHFSREHKAFADQQAAVAEQEWFQKLPANQQASLEQRNHSFAADRYDGKMRELDDFLGEVDGLADAVKSLVRIIPALGMPSISEAA